jgi:hypothetical protein
MLAQPRRLRVYAKHVKLENIRMLAKRKTQKWRVSHVSAENIKIKKNLRLAKLAQAVDTRIRAKRRLPAHRVRRALPANILTQARPKSGAAPARPAPAVDTRIKARRRLPAHRVRRALPANIQMQARRKPLKLCALCVLLESIWMLVERKHREQPVSFAKEGLIKILQVRSCVRLVRTDSILTEPVPQPRASFVLRVLLSRDRTLYAKAVCQANIKTRTMLRQLNV